MEKTRKILSIVTIVFTALLSLLLIFWLFGLDLLGDNKLKVFLTLGSLAVGGFFAINSLNMTIKNKTLGWVSFGLITGAVFLIILTSWLNVKNNTVSNITITLGLISVLFNIIVSSGLDLGKSHLAIQIIVYIIVGVLDVFATLLIFGVLDISKVWAWLVTLILVALVGVIVLKVLAKRIIAGALIEDDSMVKVSKKEYAMLIEKAKLYDELIAKQNQNSQN
ncbi:MAG: hypothetical protein SPK63_00435 [Eubacteriales bacterium]|nr:hypothetical protein [Eubacteriales bacterium]